MEIVEIKNEYIIMTRLPMSGNGFSILTRKVHK